MGLRSVGYGTSAQAVGEVTPSASANRVDYARPHLREWYVNGPMGIEQGFTIPHRPAVSSTALTLSMAITGNVHASLEHAYAVCELAKRRGLTRVAWHAFLDGRDPPPPSAAARPASAPPTL